MPEVGKAGPGRVTAMLAGIRDLREAEIAFEAGADILHLGNRSAPLSPELVAATAGMLAGRARVTAEVGPLAAEPDRLAAGVKRVASAGVDAVMVPLSFGGFVFDAIGRLSECAGGTRLFGILYADREPDLLSPLPYLAKAGFCGVMLSVEEKSGGGLLFQRGPGDIADFVATARDNQLEVGLAGALEAPDVPRLLALRPDFLGFRSALCTAESAEGRLEFRKVRAIRALIPRSGTSSGSCETGPPGRAVSAVSTGMTEQVFVRDFVLPMRIGAYRFEHAAPQKVRFDVSVEVARARGAPQGMAQVFSYDLITDGIRALAAQGHVVLVETLADRIAALVLRHPQAQRVTVRVEKLDLGPGGVGVQMVVERPGTEEALEALLAALEEGAPASANRPQKLGE